MTLDEAIVQLKHEISLKNPILDRSKIASLNLSIQALQWIKHIRPFIFKPKHSLLPGETLK